MEWHFRSDPEAASASRAGLSFWAVALPVLGVWVLSCPGCARSGSPIVAGPGHLAVGWFVERKPAMSEAPQSKDTPPLCIDVEGVGILLSPGRFVVGYSQTNYVAVPAGNDSHVKLSNIEVFTGRPADAHAYVMSSGGGATAPVHFPTSTEVQGR